MHFIYCTILYDRILFIVLFNISVFMIHLSNTLCYSLGYGNYFLNVFRYIIKTYFDIYIYIQLFLREHLFQKRRVSLIRARVNPKEAVIRTGLKIIIYTYHKHIFQ